MSDDQPTPPPHDEAGPHDSEADEPLGPFTPDDETPAGDTPEVHDEVSPHDLPPGSKARRAAEDAAGESGGTRGNQ
jgi:hypothetical protein